MDFRILNSSPIIHSNHFQSNPPGLATSVCICFPWFSKFVLTKIRALSNLRIRDQGVEMKFIFLSQDLSEKEFMYILHHLNTPMYLHDSFTFFKITYMHLFFSHPTTPSGFPSEAISDLLVAHWTFHSILLDASLRQDNLEDLNFHSLLHYICEIFMLFSAPFLSF